MSMSGKAQTIQRYYELGVWSKERVRVAVEKGWITEEEYQSITGEEYVV